MAPPDKSRYRSSSQNFCRFFALHTSRHKTHLRVIILLFLSCFLIFLHHILSHNVNLNTASLCAINQNFPSHRRSNSLNSTKFSILTFVDGHALSTIAGPYPSFLESRSIYASLHGYTLRMYFHRPDVRRPLVWSKPLAIHDIFFPDMQDVSSAGEQQNMSAPLSIFVDEWVWLLDLDALIFNFNVKLESIVESSGNRDVDIIIACDHNGLNAGSFLVRKSEWSRQFLKRWWLSGNDRDVPMIDKLFEQAVLTELVKRDKSVAAHVYIAPIREFNAYGYPSSDLYLFRAGDFVVHCPGPTLKKWLPAYAREWERMMKDCKLRELWMDAGMQLEAPAVIADH